MGYWPKIRNRRKSIPKSNLERTVDETYGINVAPNFYNNTDNRTNYRNSQPKIISKINLNSVPKNKNIVKEFNSRFEKANGNLEVVVQEFMREFVFNDNNFDYKGIGQLDKMIEYFDKLSGSRRGSHAKQTLETAKTVLSHLNNYLQGNKQGTFNKYLFGEYGVLTTKRLEDMNKIVNKVAKDDNPILIKSNANKKYWKLRLTEDPVSRFNVSYGKKDKSGKVLVDINDKDSEGMNAKYGNLYWKSFDKMFDGVNTRRSVTNYVKKRIRRDLASGAAQNINGYAWYR